MSTPTPTIVKKPKSSKKSSKHVPVSKLIIAAIAALKERNGSSQVAIIQYILKNHKELDVIQVAKQIRIQLKHLVLKGLLKKVKASYALTPKATKPKKAKKVKKVKAAKKPKKKTSKKVKKVKKSKTAKKAKKAKKPKAAKKATKVAKSPAKKATKVKKVSPKKSVKAAVKKC